MADPTPICLDSIDFLSEECCLHVKQSCTIEDVVQSFRMKCQSLDRSLAVSTLPVPPRFSFRRMRRPTVYDWFADEADLNLHKAKQEIDKLPVPISPDFRCNAMNPMRFLALAVALRQNADVLLYESSGMDPLGIEQIHHFAKNNFRGLLVHVCWNQDVASCPNEPNCSRLQM